MSRRIGLLALPLSLLLACAPAEEEDPTDGGEAAFTEADAACYDAPERDGQSATEARARCLTEQANRLLDEQIARKEDPHDAALAAFKGKLRVAAETGCFTEDVSGKWLGLVQNDIDDRRDVGILTVQLKATIEFLKYYYRDLDGYPNHFFDAIDICPNQQVGGDLRIQGSRLQIGIPTGFGGFFRVHTGNRLREMWTAGEHLQGSAALEAIKGIRWSILDPVGTPRMAARRVIGEVITKMKGKLEEMKAAPEPELRLALSQTVRSEVPANVKDESGRSIRERALDKITAMTAEELADFVARWKVAIEQKDLPSGAEDGAVMMRDVGHQKNVSVEVTQEGWFNFNNYKEISVDLNVFLPGGSKFTRYVELNTTQTTVKVNQVGTFNFQLNDVVTVAVEVLYQKTATTAALDHALGP